MLIAVKALDDGIGLMTINKKGFTKQMPQLDPQFFLSQFFWIVICFALFYACVHHFIVPRLRSIIETRSHTNEGNATKAHMLSLQIAELKSEAHAKTLEMNRLIDDLKHESNNKFQEYSKNVLDKFNAKIKEAHEAAMKDIEKQRKLLTENTTDKFVSDLASKVIVRLTGSKI